FLDDRQGVLVALGVQVADVQGAVLVGIGELPLGLCVREQRHGLVVLPGLLVGGHGVHARHLVLGIGGDLGGIDFGRLGIALQAHQRTAAQVQRLGLVGPGLRQEAVDGRQRVVVLFQCVLDDGQVEHRRVVVVVAQPVGGDRLGEIFGSGGIVAGAGHGG